ncbi:MAG: molybdopterin-dependent oxidoreductase, partial [Bacteroidia bacterium]|nr:molybdopterin-dependent oxidoreductase [Bacteroidia bacterium]
MTEISKNISRRSFIKLSGMTGAVLAVGYYMPALGKDPKIVNAGDAASQGIDLNAWISIDTTGKVTITNHRAEMGQGSFQSVPQIIAEELEVNLTDVNIVFAQGDQKKYGSQITGG